MAHHPKEEQYLRIATRLLKSLKEEGGAKLKAGEPQLCTRIANLLLSEEAVVADLDRKARALLDQHLSGAPAGIDRQQMLLMIRKKLAKDLGVPL